MIARNEVYKGFKCLDVLDLSEYDSVGFYMKHEKTGLEVFKILNKDSENLFSFAFRTPSENSTGAAHVLEHSVLCGSEHYPVKDAFINLSKQSVNTYLNAFTCSDHTVFPASSLVKADFFNMFSVYADAVFFPLLKPEIFMQECHRLEFDENGNPVIQGVVYNEMKGNYSSFEGIAGNVIDNTVFEGTSYAFDSGGDPAVIPELTVEQLRDFHKRHYCAANCLVFLYGDIPLEEELDFLDSHVIQNLKESGSRIKIEASGSSSKIASHVESFGPADDETSETDSRRVVSMVWKLPAPQNKKDLPDFTMQAMFLDELLWGNDSAPVAKKMLSLGLGDDIAMYTGIDVTSPVPYICFSMYGTPKEKESQFKQELLSELKRIVSDGFEKKDFERSEMGFEFSNREVKRPGGNPFSFVLMRRTLRGWLYSDDPCISLSYRKQFDKIKETLKANPRFMEELIQKFILDNDNFSLISVEPSVNWSKERELMEKNLCARYLEKTGKENALSLLTRMKEFQAKEEDVSVLPRIKVSQLPQNVEMLHIEKEFIGSTPIYISTEPTNGIAYFKLGFPFDTLTSEEYQYVPFLAHCIAQVGLKGESWDSVLSRKSRLTGSFFGSTHAMPSTCEKKAQEDMCIGRDWFFFSFKALEEKVPDVLKLLESYIDEIDFHDEKRMKDLVANYLNEAVSSVIPSAHSYALSRSISSYSRHRAVREITDGLTSVLFAKKLSQMKISEVCDKLETIYQKILNNGSVIHINNEKQGIEKYKQLVADFVIRRKLTAPVARPASNHGELIALIDSVWQKNANDDDYELFNIPGTVGFVAKTFKSAGYATKKSVADAVFAHCLDTTDLWQKVRMEGGAYGVYVVTTAKAEASTFVTYRDPKPFLALKAFEDSLNNNNKLTFSDEEVEKAIIGCYSDIIEPYSPATRGSSAFSRALSGEDNEELERIARYLLEVKPQDLADSCTRFRESLSGRTKTVILCPKSLMEKKISSKIMILPL